MGHENDMLGEFSELDTTDVDTEVLEAPKPEKADTETETVVEKTADTETETEEAPEVSPNAELLKQYGLDGEFKTPEEALASIKYKNQQIEEQRRRENSFIAQLSARREQLIESPVKEPAPKLTPEEYQYQLSTNPDFLEQHLKNLGYVKRDEIRPLEGQVQKLTQRSALSADAQIVSEMPELKDVARILAEGSLPIPGQNKMFDAINAELVRDPLINRLYENGQVTNGEVIGHFYNRIKERAGNANGPKPAASVFPLTPDQKAVAKTSGGGVRKDAKKDLSNITVAELDALDMKQTEKLLFEAGRLSEASLLVYRPPK